MAICCISVLTFKRRIVLFSFLFSAHGFSNFYEGKWTYHDINEAVVFEKMPVIDDLPWLKVSEIAKKFNLLITSEKNSTIKILNPKNKLQVVLSARNKEVLGFWGNILLSSQPKIEAGEFLVPLDFGDRVLRPLLEGQAPKHPFPIPSTVQADIIIDPGHGGNDWGAEAVFQGKKYFEKNLNLEIAKEIRNEIEKHGIKCVLTRDEDVYLGLPERVAFANRNQAKLFISIHLNYDPSSKLKGFEIYLLSLKENDLSESHKALLLDNMKIPRGLSSDLAQKALLELKAEMNFKDSLSWANIIDMSLSKNITRATKKAVRVGPFYVLYGADMPAILLEMAYINNSKDMQLLIDPKKRSKTIEDLSLDLAKSLKTGIVRPQ